MVRSIAVFFLFLTACKSAEIAPKSGELPQPVGKPDMVCKLLTSSDIGAIRDCRYDGLQCLVTWAGGISCIEAVDK